MTTPYTPSSTFHTTINEIDSGDKPNATNLNLGNEQVADNAKYLFDNTATLANFNQSQYLLYYFNTFSGTPPSYSFHSTGTTVGADIQIFNDTSAHTRTVNDIIELEIDIPYQIVTASSSQLYGVNAQIGLSISPFTTILRNTTYYQQVDNPTSLTYVDTISLVGYFVPGGVGSDWALYLSTNFQATTDATWNFLQTATAFDGNAPVYTASIKIWTPRP